MERTTVEICAGAGGQAIGLEEAGFAMLAAAELDGKACATLRTNRPSWDVRECDVRDLDAAVALRDDGSLIRGFDLVE